MRHLTLAMAIGIAAIFSARLAHANLTNLCYVDQASAPWFAAKQDVPVYYINSGSYSALAITGFSDYDMSVALKRATTIWNEYGGGSIKLRFAGTTTNLEVNGAIVISGNTTSCMPGMEDCDTSPNNCAPASTIPIINSGVFAGSEVQLAASYLNNQGGCTNTAGNWTTGLGTSGYDLVGIMVHELGHAAFNIGHPGDTAKYGPSCADQNVSSTMNSTIPNRAITHWDREIVQQRYGVRSQYSHLMHNKMLSDTSWKGGFQLAYFVAPLFRAGSLSNAWNTREMGWIYGGSTVQPGGAGYYDDVGGYATGVINNWSHQAASTVGAPIAVATKESYVISNGHLRIIDEAIVAYQKFVSTNGSTIYTDPNGYLCYRQSSDGGATWGAEVCPTGAKTYTNGLTAAYDPYSGTYLIAYIHTDSTAVNDIVILTVPTSGSSTPSAFTALGASALHAPAIACTGAANRCLVVYEGINGNGSLTGKFVGVTLSNGIISTASTWQWSLGFFDTPGITYKSDDNTFRLALTDSNAYIYSYKMGNSDPSLIWYASGDIWNNQLSQVSTAAMSVRVNSRVGPSPSIYAWFIKDW